MELMRVDLESITSKKLRSQFNEGQLDLLADQILDSQGLVRPLILKRVGFEQYEVVDGDFEYFASLRACEKNPRESEVNCMIIIPENENIVSQQLKVLKTIETPSQPNTSSFQGKPESQFTITNLELRVEKGFSDFRQEIRRLENRISDMESRESKRIEPIEALNTLSLQELATKLGRVVRGNILEKIINEREKNGKFKTCADAIKRVKGLGDKTMINIVDTFSVRY